METKRLQVFSMALAVLEFQVFDLRESEVLS